MSIANTHPHESYPCAECSDPTPPRATVKGSFCCYACYHRHRGRNLLQYLKHDHRFCFTCFRQVKRVEKAPPSAPECAIGFQYPTEHATSGIVTRRLPNYQQSTDAATQYDPPTRIGTICQCGQTDHQSREPVIQNQDFRQVVGNLYYALEAFRKEGQHDHRIDITALADALRDQKAAPDWDFALAVGHAIQSED